LFFFISRIIVKNRISGQNKINPRKPIKLIKRGDFMPKKKISIKPSKSNPINDGVKNAAAQQNMGAKLNMPMGAKKPENTPK
jgi:hypothetical protein